MPKMIGLLTVGEHRVSFNDNELTRIPDWRPGREGKMREELNGHRFCTVHTKWGDNIQVYTMDSNGQELETILENFLPPIVDSVIETIRRFHSQKEEYTIMDQVFETHAIGIHIMYMFNSIMWSNWETRTF